MNLISEVLIFSIQVECLAGKKKSEPTDSVDVSFAPKVITVCKIGSLADHTCYKHVNLLITQMNMVRGTGMEKIDRNTCYFSPSKRIT